MKVLCMLSGFGKGSGGHFHSLNNITRALHGYKDIDIDIVSIGNVTSPILKDHPRFLGNLEFKWYAFLSLDRKLRKILKGTRPDVVHCYDGGTALLMMMLPIFRNTRIIHTRCGGANERFSVAQVLRTVILFSRENLASFQKNPRFAQSDLHLIPNRVFEREHDTKALEALLKKDPDTFTFMRTARIGKSYSGSILQGIELIRRLETNRKVKFIVIGVVEEESYVETIRKAAQDANVTLELYNTPEYTREASRFLYAADAVIGTGRGTMEAMSARLPVFAPLSDMVLPVLIDAETLPALFERNFSPRGKVEGKTEEAIVATASKLVNDPDFLAEARQFARKMAEEHFLITDAIKEKYWSIYHREMEKSPRGLVWKNLLPIVYYLNSYRILAKRVPQP
ncbi:glycosyltransferase family 4 protein [Flavobacterium sp. HJ-32-4]|uniref:glycosyltransferase family 4 protein n=1 Tax=Flavobacterium sp. HJ-32-4 TaxID=1160795 RepID=UPI001F13CFA1|nr:glycosyltransferase family 4 protein [Flavobacterium sp. HJ-32-4]UMY65840.1 glycosyltransferase family 4 protein [Flavobacterium sp. HJ-32-4]